MKVACWLNQILFLIGAAHLLQGCQKQAETVSTAPRIHLYVASSLGPSVRCLNHAYQKLYPNRRISLSLLGSQSARLQIERGAPAGVFISASKKHIDVLNKRQLIAQSKWLGTNQVVLLTRHNSPVHHLKDLVNTKSLGIGAENVPIGHYSWQIIKAQGKKDSAFIPRIRKIILSQDLSAKSLKGRAIRGELESVFLYRSDLGQVQDSFREVDLAKPLSQLGQAQLYIALTRRRTQEQIKDFNLEWYNLMLSNAGYKCLKLQGISIY